MKKLKLLFAGVATIASGGAAEAADAAQPRVVKSPPPPPMPAFSWTGCHVGLHGGWAWGRETTNARCDGVTLDTGTSNVDSEGALFGGQLGCDYQFANGWVVGIGGDAAASNIEGQGPYPIFPGRIGTEAQWLASVTGRLGYAGWHPQTLVYVKGGGAWTRQQYNITSEFGAPIDGEFSKTFGGWTAGGGIAWALSANMSIFVEYNHYDFRGSFSNSFVFPVPTGLVSVNIGAPRIDAVKVGLDLRF